MCCLLCVFFVAIYRIYVIKFWQDTKFLCWTEVWANHQKLLHHGHFELVPLYWQRCQHYLVDWDTAYSVHVMMVVVEFPRNKKREREKKWVENYEYWRKNGKNGFNETCMRSSSRCPVVSKPPLAEAVDTYLHTWIIDQWSIIRISWCDKYVLDFYMYLFVIVIIALIKNWHSHWKTLSNEHFGAALPGSRCDFDTIVSAHIWIF